MTEPTWDCPDCGHPANTHSYRGYHSAGVVCNVAQDAIYLHHLTRLTREVEAMREGVVRACDAIANIEEETHNQREGYWRDKRAHEVKNEAVAFIRAAIDAARAPTPKPKALPEVMSPSEIPLFNSGEGNA